MQLPSKLNKEEGGRVSDWRISSSDRCFNLASPSLDGCKLSINQFFIIDKLTEEVNDEWCRISSSTFPTDTASCEITSFRIITDIELEIFCDSEGELERKLLMSGLC